MQTDASVRAPASDKLLPGISSSRRSRPSRRSSQDRWSEDRRSPNPTIHRLPEQPHAEVPLLPRRLGRYSLFDHIGRGGMADIFLAQTSTDLGASRLLVIKEMRPDLAGSASFTEMLVKEAKLAARLTHANVVQVEDLGREGSTLYIAMEYVEGLDLRELLRRCARQKVALPIEFSLRIVIEALKGLSYAHRARGESGLWLRIVHRDVSPSNVLLSFEGEVKLCDFGIARANPLATRLSEETIAGKAGYMSPEQARGDALDARSDIFSVGIILWELLAGRRLYKAGPGETLLNVARRAPVPPLPTHGLQDEEVLHAIVARALATDRDARYGSAAEMLQDLEEYAASARMMASPIRFRDWLTDHWAADVLGTRRARALVLRALAEGPAAVIEPIIGESWPPELDADVPPSAFPVITRSEPLLPEPPVFAQAEADASEEETPSERLALIPPAPLLTKEELGAMNPMMSLCAAALAAVAFLALWLLAMS